MLALVRPAKPVLTVAGSVSIRRQVIPAQALRNVAAISRGRMDLNGLSGLESRSLILLQTNPSSIMLFETTRLSLSELKLLTWLGWTHAYRPYEIVFGNRLC